MKLPKELTDKSEWVITGPMGPDLPEHLHALPVLAVDGGAQFATKIDVWVGDSDSYKKTPEAPYVFHLPEDKDASDFSLSLGLFNQQIHYCFHLWGFAGGRKDHELFVWGEILSFLEKHPESKFILYNQKGSVETHFVGAGHWKFHHEGLFSLGSLRKIRVRLTGQIKYPIREESWLPALISWGLSNEGQGEIILETDGPAFLHYPENP